MAEFTNQATLIYNDTVANSNVVIGNIIQPLSAEKTAVRSIYTADGTLTYVISLTNSSTVSYTGLTVTDDLGAYTLNQTRLVPLSYIDGSVKYYVNGVLQTAPTVTSADSLAITGISVPAGGNAVIVYEVRPNNFAPLDSEATITNTASITGNGIAEAITASETVSAEPSAVLSISKSLSPSTVTANGQITYTFVIQNTGNIAADTALGAVVTDTFDPVLKNITAVLNGTTLTAGTEYTYDQTTGVFTTSPGTITVPAAAFTRDETTGAVQITPSIGILTVTGTI